MTTPFTKPWTNSLARASVTGDPCLSGRSGAPKTPSADYQPRDGHPPRWEADHFHSELVHRNALFPAPIKRTAIQSP